MEKNKLDFGLCCGDDRDAFAFLPHGAVRAASFLENQMILMKNGITGEMEKYPDYTESEWLGREGENWERGPYYLRGLVALAYTLDDGGLKAKADRWINAIIASQRDGGMFGPRTNEDWWSRMPVLMALRDYLDALEYRGEDDPRIIPFITDYFKYQYKHLPDRPLESWARARGGDNIDSVYWLYNRLYDENDPSAASWLLDLAKILHDQTQDWSYIMNNTTVREHVVNTSQALKMPVLYSMQSGSEYDRAAFENALLNISIDHGRIDGLPNSDEAARDNRSTRGSELCGIVEGMLSTEIALRVLREPWIGDRLEKLAYNALPCGYSYDYLSHVYFILQNQVMATNGYHEFDCDHGDSSAFGAPSGFDCCFANNHMGWPDFVRSMWMAKNNGGIAALAYGPCSVSYRGISFVERTGYPFRDRIEFEYTGVDKTFELTLRIPEWCEDPSLTVNGEPAAAKSGCFCSISRSWKKGDICTLTLPMTIKTVSGYNLSAAVTRGPLIYSLPVKESWSDLPDNDSREIKMNTFGKLRNREVRPASAWNYTLSDDYSYSENGDIPLHPFTPESAPCFVSVSGSRVPQWQLDGNIAAVQPYGRSGRRARPEKLRLVPYGCTRLKITHFPKTQIPERIIYTPEKIIRSGKELYEFSFVTVPEAVDHIIALRGRGSGVVQINGAYKTGFGFTGGEYRILSAKSLISDPARTFSSRHYNNIRVSGAESVSLEIIPVGVFDKLSIKELTVGARFVSFRVNADRSFAPVKVFYGERPGVYERSVEGFRSDRVIVNMLEPSKTYSFALETSYNGGIIRSDEITLTTLEGSDPQDEAALFDISVTPAFESVCVKFRRVERAKYYEIEVSDGDKNFVKRISDIRFNPYKGSGIFESDVTSLTLENSGGYTIEMRAYSPDNALIGKSTKTKLLF